MSSLNKIDVKILEKYIRVSSARASGKTHDSLHSLLEEVVHSGATGEKKTYVFIANNAHSCRYHLEAFCKMVDSSPVIRDIGYSKTISNKEVSILGQRVWFRGGESYYLSAMQGETPEYLRGIKNLVIKVEHYAAEITLNIQARKLLKMMDTYNNTYYKTPQEINAVRRILYSEEVLSAFPERFSDMEEEVERPSESIHLHIHTDNPSQYEQVGDIHKLTTWRNYDD